LNHKFQPLTPLRPEICPGNDQVRLTLCFYWRAWQDETGNAYVIVAEQDVEAREQADTNVAIALLKTMLAQPTGKQRD
jgi:hypothetical protein